jgi:hypothetical protein
VKTFTKSLGSSAASRHRVRAEPVDFAWFCLARSKSKRASTAGLHRLEHGSDVGDQDQEIPHGSTNQDGLGLREEEKV